MCAVASNMSLTSHTVSLLTVHAECMTAHCLAACVPRLWRCCIKFGTRSSNAQSCGRVRSRVSFRNVIPAIDLLKAGTGLVAARILRAAGLVVADRQRVAQCMLCPWQMALNGEREKYFGELLLRETAALDALCQAPGAGNAGCGSAPEVSAWAASPVLIVTTLLA